MPESHGADVRQSPYVSRLAGIEPEGVTALALATLALLDAINAGKMVATDTDTRALIEALYPLQDALHGSGGGLPKALAGFLSTAAGAHQAVGVHRPYPMRVSDGAFLLKACSNSFGWLSAILGAIAKDPDCGGEVRRLAGAERSIADDMEDRAEVRGDDMKTGGVQA
jgi:hypothetical protein